MIPDPRGEEGERRGILDGERTNEPSLMTVNGAAAAFLFTESFLNKGLCRKVEFVINSGGTLEIKQITKNYQWLHVHVQKLVLLLTLHF